MNVEEAVKKLTEFQSLPDGWDGPNSKKISTIATRITYDLIQKLELEDNFYVVPGCDGSVQLEFGYPHVYGEEPIYVEVSVSTDKDR